MGERSASYTRKATYNSPLVVWLVSLFVSYIYSVLAQVIFTEVVGLVCSPLPQVRIVPTSPSISNVQVKIRMRLDGFV